MKKTKITYDKIEKAKGIITKGLVSGTIGDGKKPSA